MTFALREMRRAKVRFGLLMASVALLVFLILFQQALQDGLVTSFIGAIRNQSAPVLVYSVDGGTSSVAVIGYDTEGLGSPTTLTEGRLPGAEGEAVALASSADEGFDLGATVTVEPGGYELTVVGLADQIGLQAGPTLFTDYATHEQAVAAANPDARGAPPSVITLEPAEGVSAATLVERVNEAVPDAEALTRADAADLSPGVSQVRQSFQLIFLLFALVVPLVTGLFFLIITLQKAGSLTLLRAVGVPAGALVRSLLFQVGIVLAVGIALGVALYTPLSSARIGSIPLSFSTGAVAFWAVLLMALGLLSALFAARRVLAIDPIEATKGAGA
jgi:putative ABC transport system permease protein